MGDFGVRDWRSHLALLFNFLSEFISGTHLYAAWLKCDQQFNSIQSNSIRK